MGDGARTWRWLAAALLLAASSCAATPPTAVKGTYEAPSQAYTVTMPAGAWTAHPQEASDAVVFAAAGLPGRIAVQVTPMPAPAPSSIMVLARDQLVGFKENKLKATTRRVISQCEAVCQDWEAKVDDVPVLIRSCVFVDEGRVYDLWCWAAPNDFAALAQRFDAFLQGFHLKPVGKASP